MYYALLITVILTAVVLVVAAYVIAKLIGPRSYNKVKGEPFDWLYVDFQTLSCYAAENGFRAELVKEGKHYDYLARLTRTGL